MNCNFNKCAHGKVHGTTTTTTKSTGKLGKRAAPMWPRPRRVEPGMRNDGAPVWVGGLGLSLSTQRDDDGDVGSGSGGGDAADCAPCAPS